LFRINNVNIRLDVSKFNTVFHETNAVTDDFSVDTDRVNAVTDEINTVFVKINADSDEANAVFKTLLFENREFSMKSQGCLIDVFRDGADSDRINAVFHETNAVTDDFSVDFGGDVVEFQSVLMNSFQKSRNPE
jgi:hypothetical protein